MEIRHSIFTEAFKLLLSTTHGCKWQYLDGKAAGHDIVSLLHWDWGVSPYLTTNVLLTRPAPLFAHNFELNFDGVWNTLLAGKVAPAHWRSLQSESCENDQHGFSISKYFQKICGTPPSLISSIPTLRPLPIFCKPQPPPRWKHPKRMLNFGFQQVYANSGRIAGEFWLISRQM